MTDEEKVGRTWFDLIYITYVKFIKLSFLKKILLIVSIILVFIAISFFSYWNAKPGEKVSFLFGIFETTKPLTHSTLVGTENTPGKKQETKIPATAEKEISKTGKEKSTAVTHKPEKDKSKIEKPIIPVKFQEFTVLVKNENGNIEWDLSHKIISVLKRKGFSAGSAPFFTNKFVSSGKYDRIFRGSPAEVTALGLDKHIGCLILGRKSVSFSENSGYEDLVTATVSVEIHEISTKSGAIENSFTVTDKGAGYSKLKAEEMALENMLKSLSTRL